MHSEVSQPVHHLQERELPFARLPPDSPRPNESSTVMDVVWVPVDSLPQGFHELKHAIVAGLAGVIYRYTQREEFVFDVLMPSDDTPGRAHATGLTLATTGAQLSEILTDALRSARPVESVHPNAPLALKFFADDALGGLEAQLRAFAEGREVAVGVGKRGAHWEVGVAYNQTLFRRATALRLGRHIIHLAAQNQSDPASTVTSYALLTESEAQERQAWQSRDVIYPSAPVHLRFEENARRTPNALAVADDDARLTYRELNERANAIARRLVSCGVTPGERVVVCLPQSTEVVAAMLGIFKAGAIYVPVAPEYPSERLRVMLDDTRPSVILTSSGADTNLPPVEVARIDLSHDFSTGKDSSGIFSTSDDGLTSHHPQASDVAYIIYTSGTTGTPKGVMVSHGNLIQYVHSASERFGFHAGDCFSAVARPTFSISFFELLIPLWIGGSARIVPREHLLDFRRFVGTLAELTVMHLSPSLLRQLVAHLAATGASKETVASLRHVSSGGDVVPPDLQESLKGAFPKAELFVIYGCSEISCMGTTYEIPRHAEVMRSYVGKAFDNVHVDVVTEQLDSCPIGLTGEICFSGAGIGLGYFNRPDLTKERFIDRNGRRFYRTGDVGRFDESGNVEIMGRSDFQVKVRGIRIEPGEVEYAIRSLEGVRDAVVVSKKLASGEDGLVAYLVLSDSAPSIPEMRQTLESKLPDYMVPSVFVILKALPVNINNKLDRRALPDPTPEDYLSLRSYSPPRSATEKRLVALWEELLDMRPIGIDERFFDLGGTSLLVLTMMIGIEKALGATLPLSALLVAPTIRELASRIDAGGDPTGNEPVLLRPGTGKLPLFFVHDGDGEVMPYHGLAQQIRPGHAVYGLPPIGRDGHIMTQTRLTEVAHAYVESVQKIQPHGPYLLGGLCIGGFVAFEMARQLKAKGEVVGLLALMDVAFANAAHKSLAKLRMDRFASVFGTPGLGSGAGLGPGAAFGPGAPLPLSTGDRINGRGKAPKNVWSMLQSASKKVRNLVVYEASARTRRTAKRARIRALRYALDRDLPAPPFARGLTVDDVLRFAEREYKTPPVYEGRAYLLLATKRDPVLEETGINDTPYQELFAQKHLGWEGKVTDLRVREVSGGHSSMLQLPNVLEIAEAIQERIDEVESSLAESRLEELD